MKVLLTILNILLLALPAMASDTSDVNLDQLREIADSLHSIGRTGSAVVVGAHAVELAERHNNPTEIIGTNAAQGVFLRSLGRIDEALKCYNKALNIVTSGQFRENPNQEAVEEIASMYINLSVLNLDMANKEEAASNAENATDWISKSNDVDLRSTIYGVAGSVMTGCGELDKALSYQKHAYQDALKANNTEAMFRAAAYTMLIADRLGDKRDANQWRETCQKLLPDISSVMAILVYYQAECSIALKNDNQQDALKWFNKILEIDSIDNLPFVKFDCYNNLHLAYSKLGDYKNAYLTLLKGNELRDSLWQQEKEENLRDLTIKYQTKETELKLVKSEAKRDQTLMWLFASIGMLLLAVILFVIYANRQRVRRMAREVEFANLRADIGRQLTEQYIEGLEVERQRMARELHDGVCNDLLAVQMRLPDDQARMLDACRESVRRISHELMPPEFAYANLDEVIRYYINKQEGATSRIEYAASAEDWSTVPDSIALEVYRIVQEAVGNAIKHSGADLITVKMTMNDGTLQVEIADNGTFAPSTRRGQGLGSMRRRASSIGGELTVEHPENGGTRLILRVKP